MKTLFLEDNTNSLKTIKNILLSGGIIAVPTETAYALSCDAFNVNAVSKLFEIKKRCKNKPISVMIYDISQVTKLCAKFDIICQALAEKFWPGPLTLVLKKSKEIPDLLVSGGSTIALRLTSNQFLQTLMRETQLILTATSANLSGNDNLFQAEEVFGEFNSLVDAVIFSKNKRNYNKSKVSTIAKISNSEIEILREGAIPSSKILSVYDKIKSSQNKTKTIVLGITGPSGAGKTTCLNYLKNDKKYYTIDADQIAKKLTSDAKCLKTLCTAFGERILTKNGDLDRQVLANIAFSSDQNLKILNNIMFPKITKIILKKIDMASQKSTIKAVIIDAAALFESGVDKLCDETIAILAPKEIRINRLIARDNISTARINQRLLIQAEDDFYRQNCSYTINSNISKTELCEKISHLVATLTESKQDKIKN